MSLQGAKVIVIGGSSGMGFAIAKAATVQGAQVLIASRSVERLNFAAASIGDGVTIHPVDLLEESSIAALFEAAGPIDHLLIPGSAVKTGPLRDLPLDDALLSMRSKYFGPYLAAKHAQIVPTGSITLFSGILSRRPGKDDALLAGINAAVEGMGRALARDLAPIRVNVISPGMTRGTSAYDEMPDAAREGMFTSIAERLPAGRVGTPDDVAQLALMLMTNGFITGTVIDIDGGGLLT
jgi:NAD(P)-dependent dehydrogenase (short-subunit alcohol dehydrogenase family)